MHRSRRGRSGRRSWAMEGGGGGGFQASHSPLTVSMLEPALLLLLKEQPRHGYALLADLQQLEMSTVHPSMIYRSLREMEDLGWIQSEWDVDETQGPPRRNYRLNGEGESVLLNWQKELEKNKTLIELLLKRLKTLERS